MASRGSTAIRTGLNEFAHTKPQRHKELRGFLCASLSLCENGGVHLDYNVRFNQRNWRVGGAVAVCVSAAMALFGTSSEAIRVSKTVFLLYWLVFFVFLVVAMFCAALDFRYIRLQYLAGKQEIFRQTLGEERFRKSLREKDTGTAEEDKDREDEK